MENKTMSADELFTEYLKEVHGEPKQYEKDLYEIGKAIEKFSGKKTIATIGEGHISIGFIEGNKITEVAKFQHKYKNRTDEFLLENDLDFEKGFFFGASVTINGEYTIKASGWHRGQDTLTEIEEALQIDDAIIKSKILFADPQSEEEFNELLSVVALAVLNPEKKEFNKK